MCLILETLVTIDDGILDITVLIDGLMEIGNRVEGFNLIVSRSQFLHKREGTDEWSLGVCLLRMLYINFFSGL